MRVMIAPFMLGFGCVGTAAAQEEPPARVRAEQWYGWQTLISDGASAAMVMATFAVDGKPEVTFWTLGITTYALAPPIVHIAHGRPLTAVGDLGLRLAAPFLGLFIGAQIDKGTPPKCNAMAECRQSYDAMVAGGILAGAAIAALDAAILAREPLERAPHAEDAPTALRVWPSIALTSHGGSAQVSGIF